MEAINLSNSFDELLKEASGLYKYIGRSQLTFLGRVFGLKPEEMQVVYMDRLIQGYHLPPLGICEDLLSTEFEN